MEELIPVINKLQNVFNVVGTNEDINLPQIVVIGSQSAGKSSVLENIVGREFLPRGSGIVTRGPLILQLHRIPANGNGNEEEWGTFEHRPHDVFYDFKEIRDEIIRETDRVTGNNKGVSNIAISLNIYSPQVLNLTLVDLPGMTRVPVGDQPSDIELQIRNMIMIYIKNPNSIIVAVSAANTDLANSDALQLAREVDPDAERTIGVITKIDIMDKGTDALEVLEGKVIPLKLGFVGIINRSQHDITSGKSIRDALTYEKEYFRNNPSYRSIAHLHGTEYLTKRLNTILMNNIRAKLPSLKEKVNKLVDEAETEMKVYGSSPFNEDKGALLLSIITNFSNKYKDAIEGKMIDLNVKQLYGGARINYIYYEWFGKLLDKLDPLEELSDNDIRTTIKNATGTKNALFIPEIAFELLVKRQIARLVEPSIHCAELVNDELNKIINQICDQESKELSRFTVLREKILEVVEDLLRISKINTINMINDVLQIELSYINTAHPDFIGTRGAINNITEKIVEEKVRERETQIIAEYETKKQMQNNQKSKGGETNIQPSPNTTKDNTQNLNNLNWTGYLTSKETEKSKKKKRRKKENINLDVPRSIKLEGNLTEREEFETELVKQLLISYFNLVRKNIIDIIPKCIMFYLVNNSKQEIQNTIVTKLYKEDFLDELLSESTEIIQRRKRTRTKLKALKQAKDILNEVKEFDIK
jgi:replication fork clamp-binding protein CrfC